MGYSNKNCQQQGSAYEVTMKICIIMLVVSSETLAFTSSSVCMNSAFFQKKP